MHLQFVADTIANNLGQFKHTAEDEVIFTMEDGLSLHVYCPGGDYVFIYGKLLTLPATPYESQEICRKIASYTLIACKKMQSCICLENNILLIYMNLSEHRESVEIAQKTEEFIAEFSWWKEQITEFNYLLS